MKILHLLDKFGLKNLAMKSMVWLSTILLVSSAYANPVLNNVGAGHVQIQQTNPNSTVIYQSSPKVILNWNSFNIGPNQSTRFQQPAGGVALNRISPTEGASAIYGRLTATGQIILVNPAGIFFGPNAYVRVGGLIATTSNISDTNFLNGNYQFNQPSPYSGASIINEGQIIAEKHGLVALVAPNVINRGLIQANLGSVVLGSGSAFTVSFDNGGLINFAIDKKTMGPGNVTNTGRIIANGGSVLVTARAAQGVLDSVINMEGIIQARSVGVKNGEVIFSGDNDAGVVRVAANIDVSGKGRGQTGGNVQITGHNILIDNPTTIDASGNRQGGNILIGGNYQGKGPLPNANATVLMPEASLIANATTLGKGGNVILWADDLTRAYGSISARGGKYGGDGGFIETSGKKYLDVAGIRVDTSAPRGKFGMWLLDPSDLAISSSATSGITQVGNAFMPTTDFGSSNLNDLQLISALGTTNVTVRTVNDAGAGNGDILVCFPSCNNSNTITWNSSNTLTLDSFHDVQFFGNINGGGLTVVSGAGGTILLVSANPTFTTTGGQSWQGPVVAVGVSPTFTSTSGAINSINFTSSIAGNAGNENIVISGSGSAAGVISNINSFTKAGNGSFNLQGTNTYDGATNVNAGILLVTNDAGLGSLVGSTTVANGATLAFNGVTTGEILTINGSGVNGAGALTGTSTTLNGGITLGSNSTIGGSGAFTISGVIDGAFGLTKVGSANLTLDAANTYTGTTTINAGTITATNAGSFGTTAAGTIINSGGILFLDNVGISNEALTLNGGTLRGTGIAIWTSNVTLGTGTSNTFNSLDTSLEVSGDINGAASLALTGAGTVAIIGNTGNSTRLTSFSANANAAVDGNVFTTGDQSYANQMFIGASRTFDSSAGNINFNDIIDGDGSHALSIISGGTTTFAGSVGGGTALASLSVDASTININGGSVTTLGNQNYTGLINLGNDTTLSTTGSGTHSISIAGGVSGNQNLILAGGASSNEAYTIQGSMAVNNVTVTGGGGGGSNSLMVNSGGSQAWTLGGADSGSVSGIAGVAGAFNFNNIQNLTGGVANDAFALNGNTLSGSIDGGLGANSLAANNVTNSWMVLAPNAGTVTNLGGTFSNIQNLVGGSANDMFNLGGGIVSSVQGAGGTNTIMGGNNTSVWNFSGTNAGGATNVAGFTDIQNIMGGTGDNTFVFANGARLTGNLVGGSLSSNNTLDYSAYQAPVSVVLSATNNGVGSAGSDTITNFTSITRLEGNSSVHNMITLPNKANTITITSAKQGFINDPIFFNGFDSFTSLSGNDTVIFQGVIGTFDGNTIFINGTPMFFSGFNFDTGPFIDVAKIIQQPDTNAGSSSPGNSYLLMSENVTDNVNNLIDQLAKKFDSELNKVKINPYCFTQN